MGEDVSLFGVDIVPHQMAREVRTEWRVERHPIPKRRRRWRVVAHRIDRPGAYLVDGKTLYVHPELYPQLMAAMRAQG